MSVSLRAICQFSGQRVSIQQEMGKALIIAEKPSVATDISKALGGFKKQEDYYESDQYVLSSAVGHLLTLTGSGALTTAELEHVIERALMQIDGRIALDDLRALMEGAGYDPSGPSSDHATVH